MEEDMTHTAILKIFNRLLPQYYAQMVEWFPNGRDCIRVRLDNKREYVFTYNYDKDWSFETVICYMNRIRMKEDKRCNA